MKSQRIIFVLFFLFTVFAAAASYADDKEIDVEQLQAQHGEELMSVPFVMRYKFLKASGREWEDSSFDERLDFLNGWYSELNQDKEKVAAEAKAQSTQEKEETRQKKDEQRSKKEKAKQEARAKKEEQQQEEAEQKAFEKEVKERKQAIKELKEKQRRCLQSGICI